jgi:hypothetical protein
VWISGFHREVRFPFMVAGLVRPTLIC